MDCKISFVIHLEKECFFLLYFTLILGKCFSRAYFISPANNNYRPIDIVTAMSKLFELCLSKILDGYLCTSENQVGFKKKHATDLCIYTVKSVIKDHNHFSSAVFTCFLDASKAFDRVIHWTLFKKLLVKGVP